MSALADDFNDDETLRGRTLQWISHQPPAMLIAALGVKLAAIVSPESIWLSYADLAAMFALLTVQLFFHIHVDVTRICVRCMTSVPDKAPVRAEQFRAVLWFAHRSSGWRSLWWASGVLVASLCLDRVGVPEVIADAVVVAYLFGWVYGGWFHHRVRPWCRYCPRWDGGGGVSEPSPDPATRGTRA